MAMLSAAIGTPGIGMGACANAGVTGSGERSSYVPVL
jgi:hypothetical protein